MHEVRLDILHKLILLNPQPERINRLIIPHGYPERINRLIIPHVYPERINSLLWLILLQIRSWRLKSLQLNINIEREIKKKT
jgi:hypothetical protein